MIKKKLRVITSIRAIIIFLNSSISWCWVQKRETFQWEIIVLSLYPYPIDPPPPPSSFFPAPESESTPSLGEICVGCFVSKPGDNLCFASGNKVSNVRQKSEEFMNSFHLHTCILTQPWFFFLQKFLFTQTVRLALPPLHPPLFPPIWATLSSILRSSRMFLLHLHVRAAFNKLNSILAGHWEVISASPCTSVAIGVYHPIILSSSFTCNGFEFPSSQGDGY